jgi:GDP-mannose 6-dehydrogenase
MTHDEPVVLELHRRHAANFMLVQVGADFRRIQIFAAHGEKGVPTRLGYVIENVVSRRQNGSPSAVRRKKFLTVRTFHCTLFRGAGSPGWKPAIACHTRDVNASTGNARVAVLGLGYVGSVTAACLTHLGHYVTGVDPDAYKVQSIEMGRAPFYEPGLAELIQEGRANGRLTTTTSLEPALDQADIALICVGTPSERNGNLGLDQLRRVCGQIAAAWKGKTRRLIVAVRSTVFPGTCEELTAESLGDSQSFAVVSNPEFLREGNAVSDFLAPSLLVVGGNSRSAVQSVADLYQPLGVETCLVSLRTAEMIKYACNTFHALKVAFANEMGALSGALGIPGAEVMDTLCRDTKLNISPAYLKPGFAFGGSCLPKDLRALVYRAGRLDLKVPLLETVLPSNEQHLRRAIRKVMDLPSSRLGVFGLAFKEKTDDLLEHLIGKGRQLRVYDPHIRLEDIYGSNQRFVLAAIPHIANLMVASLEKMLEWADCVVVTQRAAAPIVGLIERSGLPVLDLAGDSGLDLRTLPQEAGNS